MKYVVDTRALLWFLANEPRLGPNAAAILSEPDSELVLPAIALAEACWIVERGRVPLSLADLLAAVDADARITLSLLDRDVIERTLTLTPITEMHDRQIVATALLLTEGGETVALLTRDENIRASGLVTVVW